MLVDLKRPTTNKLPTPIFALVIGINRYLADYENLEAAERDADAIACFLMEALGVPSANIINLRNEAATRAAIIASFDSLDKKISEAEKKREKAPGNLIENYCPAIIIYFAGHGARSPMPQEWVGQWYARESKVEMICPTDIGIVVGDRVIEGIPDRTISALVDKLCNRRGNNITVILDCCHSAGLTRTSCGEGLVPLGLAARQIVNPPPIQKDCDDIIWRSIPLRSIVLGGNSWGAFRDSHILLAGCGREEVALENTITKSGVFTTALLRLLANADINELTYGSLMRKIRLPKLPPPYRQSPHCEGRHIDRRLFNSRAAGADRSFLPGRRNEDGTSTLSAGQALGITIGSKFDIYDTNLLTTTNTSLGSVVVTKVDALTSTVVATPDPTSFSLPEQFYAKGAVFDPNEKFRVFCAEGDRLHAAFLEVTRSPDRLPFTSVPSPDLADLCITLQGDQIVLDRRHELINRYLSPRLPSTISIHAPQAILQVLTQAAQFSYHLKRTGAHFEDVRIELRRLDYKRSHDFEYVAVPFGENLIATEPATVVVENIHLGLIIHNDTDIPLYPYVFYFDPSTLSIQDWYLGPLGVDGGNTDPPLPRRSKLTIGFGDGGATPWQFHLNDDEEMDIGFLKLFLTTSPADFSSVAQDPFGPMRRLPTRQLNGVDLWGSAMSTILQIRQAEGKSAPGT